MFRKTIVRVVLDIGCSAIRVGVIEEKHNTPAKFILLERESFPPQINLLEKPDLIAEAISRLLERIAREYQLKINSAYVGVRGNFASSVVKNESIVALRGALKAKDIQSFFEKISAQSALIHYEPLGLAVRDEENKRWLTVSQSEEYPYAALQTWWVEWWLQDEGKAVLQQITQSGKLKGIDGYYAHRYALAQSALLDGERTGKVLLVDLGASGTEYSLLKNGAVVFSGGLDDGGCVLSQALTHKLQISYKEAEEGKTSGSWVDYVEALYVEKVFRPIQSALLQNRADGIADLRQIVLTGGGADKAAELAAQKVLGKPVRRAGVNMEYWRNMMPESFWQQHNLHDYLPILGVYQLWYREKNHQEPNDKVSTIAWIKKIFD